jgi:hypothetical protein
MRSCPGGTSTSLHIHTTLSSNGVAGRSSLPMLPLPPPTRPRLLLGPHCGRSACTTTNNCCTMLPMNSFCFAHSFIARRVLESIKYDNKQYVCCLRVRADKGAASRTRYRPPGKYIVSIPPA